MYIPTSFFSSQGSCITATTSTITGSGTVTTGSFISGGFVWDYWQFNNTADPINSNSSSLEFSASFNILSGSTGQAKLFLVGGGGAGGYGACNISTPPQCDPTAAGGGGGGGVVYYNQFPLASGSYIISVGYGGGNPLNGGVEGRTGANTTFTFTYPYSPFTSSVLTAYGGGRGGKVVQNAFGGNPNILVQGVSGGSAGGAVCTEDGTGRNTTIQAGYDGFGGLNGANQGNDAGMVSGSPAGVMASGGGGAGTASPAVDITFGQRTGVGGDGALYNLTGTPLYYAAGGGGAWGQSYLNVRGQSANGLGTAGIGNGGQGQTLSYPQGTTATNGTVIIAIPRCAASFSCKNFAITGSNGTLSYLNCALPYVTQSKLSSEKDSFTACLLTYSGSNTPVLLTGALTSSVISNCDSTFTSSTACHCTYIRAVPNSGTQIITLFPCNGSGSVTQSVPPAGKYFCIENSSVYSFPSGAVTEYGPCQTGSCAGISYTSSFVNCNSYTATAGGSGATFIYLPCGSSSLSIVNLSGSESMSVCAAYTASFGSLTGGGSSYSNFGTCSYQFPNTLIQKCNTSITQSVTFAGSATYIPNVGNIFTSATPGLSGSCWNVVSTTTQSADYTDIIISEQFVDCSTCFAFSGSIDLQYLVVGGGGMGGYLAEGGGGGGGGFVTGSTRLLAGQTYPVVVGLGGGVAGINAQTSSFWSSSALGGGYGGGTGGNYPGGSGSSGGGGGAWVNIRGAGGLGTAGQGFNGGSGSYTTGNNIYAGGGGGAAAAGADGSSTSNGGAGKAWLDGNYYAGGGGGARFIYNASLGLGGIGGGGRGAGPSGTGPFGTSGSANTGGGGGGNANGPVDNYGGSGIVKIRYFGSGSQATGGTISYSGSYTYHTFTASGNFII